MSDKLPGKLLNAVRGAERSALSTVAFHPATLPPVVPAPRPGGAAQTQPKGD